MKSLWNNQLFSKGWSNLWLKSIQNTYEWKLHEICLLWEGRNRCTDSKVVAICFWITESLSLFCVVEVWNTRMILRLCPLFCDSSTTIEIFTKFFIFLLKRVDFYNYLLTYFDMEHWWTNYKYGHVLISAPVH
jgi:hypothetical protein